MNILLLFLLFITVCNTHAAGNIGAQRCYQCVYVDSDFKNVAELLPPDAVSNRLCLPGKKLDENSVVRCENSWGQYNPKLLGKYENDTKSHDVSLMRDLTFGCGSFEMRGKIDGKNVQITLRSCFAKTDLLYRWKDMCDTTTVGLLAKGESNWDKELSNEMTQLLKEYNIDRSSELTLCTCTDEKCNTSIRTSSGYLCVILSYFFIKLF